MPKKQLKLIMHVALIALLMKTSLACGPLETKLTCECSAKYTMGDDVTEKLLLDVDPKNFCNQACGEKIKRDCEDYCLESIRIKLGDQPQNLGSTGLDSACKIIS